MGCNAKGEREEGEHDQDPQEGQDVQVGLVDQAKYGIMTFSGFMSIGHSREGVGVVVEWIQMTTRTQT